MKLFLFSIIFIFSLSSSFAETFSFTGKAQSEDGRFSYNEKHKVESDGKFATKITTEYFHTDGKKFGQLVSEFKKGPFIPDTVFEDSRFDLKVTTVNLGDKIVITTLKEGEKSEKTLPIQEAMFLGQGFHNFILKSLSQKKIPKKQDVKVVLPKNEDWMRFTVEHKETKKNKAIFSMELSSWALSFILGDIEVHYELPSKRLIYWRGITNIPNNRGRSRPMVITFKY